MADLGVDSGAPLGSDSNASGTVVLRGPYTTNSSGGRVGSGWIFFQGGLSGADTQKYRLLIYGDVSGAPTGPLVGVTDEFTFRSTTPQAWTQFQNWSSFGGAPLLAANTPYWIGIWAGTLSGATIANNFRVGTATPVDWFDAAVTYSSTANPTTPSLTSGTGTEYLLYFTYDPDASYIASLGRRPVPGIKGPDVDRITKIQGPHAR